MMRVLDLRREASVEWTDGDARTHRVVRDCEKVAVRILGAVRLDQTRDLDVLGLGSRRGNEVGVRRLVEEAGRIYI